MQVPTDTQQFFDGRHASKYWFIPFGGVGDWCSTGLKLTPRWSSWTGTRNWFVTNL